MSDPMIIGIPKEPPANQPLVSATPDTVKKLMKLGYQVRVETGAGEGASFYDREYIEAGADIVSSDEVWRSDAITCFDIPLDENFEKMVPASTLIARMNPAANESFLEKAADDDITCLAIDAVPRISRAQSLDVRSSMANIAGYRAVIEAANQFGRVFTGQVTAAGKVAPAKVYVIGVGVAGLSAIGTAGSMGAVVSATDVRADVADQVESLGATFVEIPVKQESADGYAKALSDDEQLEVLSVYERQAAQSDIVITTAQLPGRPSPLLLTAKAVEGMRPGSVIVDMGVSDDGISNGNCELTVPGEVIVTDNGVTIVGIANLQDRLPGQASQLFGQNMVNLFKLLTPNKDGQIVLDEDDEIIRSITVVEDGKVTWPPPPVSVSAQPDKPAEEKREQTVTEKALARASSPEGSYKPSWRLTVTFIVAVILAIALVMFAPPEIAGHFIVFELAIVIGFYVITSVTHSLHTPLMSVTNAISGIIIIGALLLVGSSNPIVMVLSIIAMIIASINIFGGFLVTHRMLKMFQRSSEE